MSAAVEANRVCLFGQLAFGLGTALFVLDEAVWIRLIGGIVMFSGICVWNLGRRALARAGVLAKRPGERPPATEWFGSAVCSLMIAAALAVDVKVLMDGAYGYAPAALVFALYLGASVCWGVLIDERIRAADRAAA